MHRCKNGGNINAGIATFGAVTVTSITGDGSGLTGVANTDFVVSTATTTSRLVVGGGVTVAELRLQVHLMVRFQSGHWLVVMDRIMVSEPGNRNRK